MENMDLEYGYGLSRNVLKRTKNELLFLTSRDEPLFTSISFETFGVETDHEGFINKIMFPKEKIISLLTKLISIKLQSPDKGSMKITMHCYEEGKTFSSSFFFTSRPMPSRRGSELSGRAVCSVIKLLPLIVLSYLCAIACSSCRSS